MKTGHPTASLQADPTRNTLAIPSARTAAAQWPDGARDRALVIAAAPSSAVRGARTG